MTGAEKKELLDLIGRLNAVNQVHNFAGPTGVRVAQLNTDEAVNILDSFRREVRDQIKQELQELLEKVEENYERRNTQS